MGMSILAGLDMFSILVLVGKVLLWIVATFIGVVFGVVLWFFIWTFLLKDWLDYRKARKEIFMFVNGYRRRVVGNNRFVVTVETLQNSFREYDTATVERVWEELVKKRVIYQDRMDNEWCI